MSELKLEVSQTPTGDTAGSPSPSHCVPAAVQEPRRNWVPQVFQFSASSCEEVTINQTTAKNNWCKQADSTIFQIYSNAAYSSSTTSSRPLSLCLTRSSRCRLGRSSSCRIFPVPLVPRHPLHDLWTPLLSPVLVSLNLRSPSLSSPQPLFLRGQMHAAHSHGPFKEKHWNILELSRFISVT